MPDWLRHIFRHDWHEAWGLENGGVWGGWACRYCLKICKEREIIAGGIMSYERNQH